MHWELAVNEKSGDQFVAKDHYDDLRKLTEVWAFRLIKITVIDIVLKSVNLRTNSPIPESRKANITSKISYIVNFKVNRIKTIAMYKTGMQLYIFLNKLIDIWIYYP